MSSRLNSPKCLDANRHGMRVLSSDMRLEELTEISVFQIFHHHAERFLTATGAQDPRNIAIFQSGQDPHVPLEVQPVRNQPCLVLVSQDQIIEVDVLRSRIKSRDYCPNWQDSALIFFLTDLRRCRRDGNYIISLSSNYRRFIRNLATQLTTELPKTQ